ncbi:MAG: twin transmembrane helix small protein [Pigmentiphaga sp.]|nr:twin transmembrane helix small protein [Pigmentiphaga sp.]
MRIFVGVVFAGILLSLGSALYYLMKDRGSGNRTVWALTWRIGLSVALFISLLVAHQLGWIDSTGIQYRQP